MRPLPISDEALFAAHCAGDRQAFSTLYARLAPALLRRARRCLPRDPLAEDLVQQTFLNAHLARERFDAGHPLAPWLNRILTNLLRDHARLRRRRVEVALRPEVTPLLSVHPEAERREDARRARAALARLREPQRRVLELHWLEERPFPEIAHELGERVVTVKVRAHRP